MDRNMVIYGRAGRLMDILARRFRMGRVTDAQYMSRRERISLAHYRAQHRAGATDYPSAL